MSLATDTGQWPPALDNGHWPPAHWTMATGHRHLTMATGTGKWLPATGQWPPTLDYGPGQSVTQMLKSLLACQLALKKQNKNAANFDHYLCDFACMCARACVCVCGGGGGGGGGEGRAGYICLTQCVCDGI